MARDADRDGRRRHRTAGANVSDVAVPTVRAGEQFCFVDVIQTRFRTFSSTSTSTATSQPQRASTRPPTPTPHLQHHVRFHRRRPHDRRRPRDRRLLRRTAAPCARPRSRSRNLPAARSSSPTRTATASAPTPEEYEAAKAAGNTYQASTVTGDLPEWAAGATADSDISLSLGDAFAFAQVPGRDQLRGVRPRSS